MPAHTRPCRVALLTWLNAGSSVQHTTFTNTAQLEHLSELHDSHVRYPASHPHSLLTLSFSWMSSCPSVALMSEPSSSSTSRSAGVSALSGGACLCWANLWGFTKMGMTCSKKADVRGNTSWFVIAVANKHADRDSTLVHCPLPPFSHL